MSSTIVVHRIEIGLDRSFSSTFVRTLLTSSLMSYACIKQNPNSSHMIYYEAALQNTTNVNIPTDAQIIIGNRHERRRRHIVVSADTCLPC